MCTTLDDFKKFRSAPLLNDSQIKKFLKEIQIKIINADWLTIGIMALSDLEAKNALNSIISKYEFIKFKDFEKLNANGNVFLKANQKTGEVYIRSENGLGEGILLTCQYNDKSIHSTTYGPFPLKFFCH